MSKTAATTETRDEATYRFSTSSDAWTFMHNCEAAKIAAAYPVLLSYEVRVLLASWMDRETADKLAGSNPVAYRFAHERAAA